ncbi:putative condensin-2 complex subunit H2 [Blattamonas nauphoetae]|uniref:Condensin-2 complex subunit H2 n=1 Tax=Blattamonas nauphoetae TaxID=2049346 RepID=A0ABQ9X2T3_9EUKA|nr:putative condensin-2 complex subunit H2 [Blattamonas nauphoetae]
MLGLIIHKFHCFDGYNLIPKEIFETKPNPVNVVSTDCWATFDPADETGTTILLTTGEVIGEEDEEDADGEGSQKEKRQEATKKAKAPIKRPFKMMKQSVLRKLTASTPLKGPPLTANLMGSVLKTVTKPSNQSTEKRGSVISPEAFLNDKTASVIYEKERNEEGIFSTQSFSNQTDFIDFFATELVRVKTIEREEKTREAEEQRKKEIQNVEKEKRKTIMNALKEEEEAASPDEEPESITADLDVDSDDEQLDAELMAPPPTDEFDRIRTAIEERVKQESLQMPRKLDEEEDKDVVDFGFEANEFRNDAAFDTSYTQVSQFINESEAWRIQTNLSQRVGTWHKHVEAILQKESNSRPFEIHTYCGEILDKLSAKFPSTQNQKRKADTFIPISVGIDEVCDGETQASVARAFTAILQLTNEMRVEIKDDEAGFRIVGFMP